MARRRRRIHQLCGAIVLLVLNNATFKCVWEDTTSDSPRTKSGEQIHFLPPPPKPRSANSAARVAPPAKNDVDSNLATKTINIDPSEAFFWRGAQSRLCKRVERYRKRNFTSLVLSYQASCKHIHKQNQHGNFLVGFYGMRLAALAFDARFAFKCIEERGNPNGRIAEESEYLLWWMQTTRTNLQKNTYRYPINNTMFKTPGKKEACKGMGKAALQHISEYARRDFRAMAKELSGTFSRGDLDEVAIHLRCGDILSMKIPESDKNYGLLQFQAYRNNIPSENVTSIGIVTAPFTSAHSRNADKLHAPVCRKITENLKSYLEQAFPSAGIHIRNNPNESIPQVMSRLVLAKYTFCARSTFCLFPAMASFGTSFVQSGGVAYFFDEIVKVYDDIKLINEPFLRSSAINARGIRSTLNWLSEN